MKYRITTPYTGARVGSLKLAKTMIRGDHYGYRMIWRDIGRGETAAFVDRADVGDIDKAVAIIRPMEEEK